MNQNEVAFCELKSTLVRSHLVFFTVIGIVALSLVDYSLGRLTLANPFNDESWVFLFLAGVIFAYNLNYMNCLFYKYNLGIKIDLKQKHKIEIMIYLYLFMIFIATLGLFKGEGFFTGGANHKFENVFIIVLSLIGIGKFCYDSRI